MGSEEGKVQPPAACLHTHCSDSRTALLWCGPQDTMLTTPQPCEVRGGWVWGGVLGKGSGKGASPTPPLTPTRGFCFFNSVAVACKQLQQQGKASKVLIVDWVSLPPAPWEESGAGAQCPIFHEPAGLPQKGSHPGDSPGPTTSTSYSLCCWGREGVSGHSYWGLAGIMRTPLPCGPGAQFQHGPPAGCAPWQWHAAGLLPGPQCAVHLPASP